MTRPDADLIASLERADYHPLWDRYKRITPIQPAAKDAPKLWRWRDFVPLTERAAHEVPIEDVERRAIILANPAYGGETITTGNLIGAFTILNPGDHAVPHRHTAAAIRFATRADGAVTIVNGRRCAMHAGDLVLTPPMCWHGHINEGEVRTAWFDAANIPLVNMLDANFFEPGSRSDQAFWEVGEGDERLWARAGMADARATSSKSQSAKYHYSGSDALAALDAIAPAADGSRLLRYVNPSSGESVMPALDCYRLRLASGAATRARRSTANAICLVVSGQGRSTIGERSFEWSEHDVFSVPHWHWASHQAHSGDADLFIVSDLPVYAALGLLREEAAA